MPDRAPLPVRPLVLLLAAALLLPAAPRPAAATDFTVGFGSLPSLQGWTFGTGGSPVATEAVAFSLGGGVLTLNTMSYGFAGAGTSAYYMRTGSVSASEPIVMTLRARLLEYEGTTSNAFYGNGFFFGFSQGTTEWGMGITPTQIRNVNGVVLSSAYDNTQFHDYRLEWSPPATLRYLVDGALVSTNNAGIALASNRILFGDGTGASNCHAEITAFQFLQGAATPATSGTWGRVKSLYR